MLMACLKFESLRGDFYVHDDPFNETLSLHGVPYAVCKLEVVEALVCTLGPGE